LIELRREGALTDVRAIIRTGIEDINSASDATLKEVGEQVISILMRRSLSTIRN